MKKRRTVGIAVALLLGLPLAVALTGVRCDRPAAEVEARYATAPSKFVEVDGLRVHYRDRGAGPAVLLLHGSNSSLFTWEGWAAELAPHHRVVTVDLPGHGLTGPDPRQRYSPSQMAEVVDGFARAIGLDKFTLGGNSMGGNVSWHYALAHPEKVDHLILVDSAGVPREEPRPFALRMFGSPVLGHVARWITPRFMVVKSIREVYGDASRVDDALIDRYQDLMLREGNREATRQRSQLGDDGMGTRLGELRVPTLILWGSRDRWILPKYAERFHAAIAGSRLAMLDGLGHVPMEEDPHASLVPVEDFLK
jgi:pimeloyl-ACP methyl ester carboxylesterase